VVATDLWTHSQVLSEKIAVLADPDPKSFAKGIHFALHDQKAAERALAAKKMAKKEYTFGNYKKKITEALEKALEGKPKRHLES
jgi:hypothetical protein